MEWKCIFYDESMGIPIGIASSPFGPQTVTPPGQIPSCEQGNKEQNINFVFQISNRNFPAL